MKTIYFYPCVMGQLLSKVYTFIRDTIEHYGKTCANIHSLHVHTYQGQCRTYKHMFLEALGAGFKNIS